MIVGGDSTLQHISLRHIDNLMMQAYILIVWLCIRLRHK